MSNSFPDFVGRDLQGRSFRNADLTNAQFTGADIRSADFSGAILVGADFVGAKAGLARSRWWLILGAIVVLAFLAGAGSCIAAVMTIRLLDPEYIAKRSLLPGLTTLTMVTLFLLGVIRWGLTTPLASLAAALAGSFIVGQALLCIVLGSEGLNRGQETGWRLAGIWSWAFMGVLFGALALTLGWQLLRRRSRYLVLPWSMGLGLALYAAWDLNQYAKKVDSTVLGQLEAWPWAIPLTIVLGSLSVYMGWRGSQEDDRFELIVNLATFFNTLGGTQFQRANLTSANLQSGNFAQTNFTQANLTQTNFHLARHLNQARLAGTIVQQRSVRDLLVNHRGSGRSYVGCNLRGAYLVNAELDAADFTDANLQDANLSGAQLDRANLTRVQAIGANLRSAQLTGACLEAWNIDQTTQLVGIDCEFVYLLNHQQERSPSSGIFAAGEFTKLFQQAIDTVDLIIRNGIDWSSLSQTIQQLQVEQGDANLTIRSIENKGDGMVVVKVAVAPETDKAQFYESFQTTYAATIQALEAKHQAAIAAKDAQIDLYREQHNDLKQITQLLAASGQSGRSPQRGPKAQCVVLKLNTGSLATGFAVTLQIGPEAATPQIEVTGQLAAAPELWQAYEDWRSAYQRSLNANFRMSIPDTQITNISRHDFWHHCETKADIVVDRLNQWLNHETSRPLKDRLLEQLSPHDPIRVLIQTDDADLRHLPLQLWDWFDRYPQAELALSTPRYQRVQPIAKPPSPVKILAILGDSQGIDVARDRALLEQLPNAAITFLVEPDRQALNDQLWAQDWDILFFAGHSQSRDGTAGYLQINATEQLTIGQLRHGLRKAIAQGLQLAIFNSCDGLGIASNLADLDLPQMIVMREPVPDRVAQEFLKHFLVEFAGGATLYQAVRSGREKLQGLEDRFPCASWLPVIYQNPGVVPVLWVEF
jgi:uncharacterized protein YjbI with pentapeptide repeats